MLRSSSRLLFAALACSLLVAAEAFAKPKDKHALPPRDTSGECLWLNMKGPSYAPYNRRPNAQQET